jgi:hypothetical protein
MVVFINGVKDSESSSYEVEDSRFKLHQDEIISKLHSYETNNFWLLILEEVFLHHPTQNLFTVRGFIFDWTRLRGSKAAPVITDHISGMSCLVWSVWVASFNSSLFSCTYSDRCCFEQFCLDCSLWFQSWLLLLWQQHFIIRQNNAGCLDALLTTA